MGDDLTEREAQASALSERAGGGWGACFRRVLNGRRLGRLLALRVLSGRVGDDLTEREAQASAMSERADGGWGACLRGAF